ncbi:ribonuclease J1 [Haloplasma contractile]|uniref:Ribonuclease J n=1 Tax=Haloplasma contractile SSD-17B TaxID=1033810 RepID=U2DZ24_9MOLU|nr:ribonuclease J [Haloplasma contractile]ERJ13482.1 Ribonuclease J protein [Haloplasma contractile SSD-17B]
MNNKNEILKHYEVGVFALGGLGEIGKNTYCIEYKNEIIIIDAGVKFPESHLLGIDYVIPDYQYLIENQNKIKGLFITHGHEDHIGGIPFLLKQLKIPKIYAGRLAEGLIKKKLEEHRLTKASEIVIFDDNDIYTFEHMSISFFRTNHSIPDSFGVSVKTPQGMIVHTGDFKFDFTPIGPIADFGKIAKLGERGVLCLLSDSTNSELPEFTMSERKVGESMKDIFRKINNRIIVATFASNIHRIQQIVEASVATNRKIAIFGRSMENTLNVGRGLGYIKCPDDTFITWNQLKYIDEKQVTILCTGSQGEPLAALSRIANGTHRQISIIPGDTVIFSSSPIPGNASSVGRTINRLFRAGADVITHSPLTDTHTSGHAGAEELKLMLQLIKPKFFMPIHGEYRMLKIHTELAVQCGMKSENTHVLDNGQVLALSKNNARVAGNVPSGTVLVDGSGIGDIGNVVIRDRKILSNDGMLVTVINVNLQKKKVLKTPYIVSRGFVYFKDSQELVREIQEVTVNHTHHLLKKHNKMSINQLKNELTDYLATFVYDKVQRKPMIIPVIMNIKQ